jgi:putative endonuclease
VPHGEQRSYVYILASKSRVLYTGVTSRLEERVREHKSNLFDGFTSQYRVHRLVYYESFPNIIPAIMREKQIKRWRREKKVALIEKENPTWDDIAEEWGKQVPPLARKPPLGRNDEN